LPVAGAALTSPGAFFGGAVLGVEAFFFLVTFLVAATFLAAAFLMTFLAATFFRVTFFFAVVFFAGAVFFLVTFFVVTFFVVAFFAVVLRRAGAFEVFFLVVPDPVRAGDLRVVFFATVEILPRGVRLPNWLCHKGLRFACVVAGGAESREDT